MEEVVIAIAKKRKTRTNQKKIELIEMALVVWFVEQFVVVVVVVVVAAAVVPTIAMPAIWTKPQAICCCIV